MGKLYRLGIAAAFVAAASLPVCAAQSGTKSGEMHHKTWKASKYERTEQGVHQMSGTVTAVDSSKGMVKVKTSEAALHLYFPPASIRNLKQGEKINVSLAFSTGKKPAEKIARAYDNAKKSMERNERGRHWMSGRIDSINHSSGVIELKTSKGDLQLQYPPKTISSLKKGEEIHIHLAYSTNGSSSAKGSPKKAKM